MIGTRLLCSGKDASSLSGHPFRWERLPAPHQGLQQGARALPVLVYVNLPTLGYKCNLAFYTWSYWISEKLTNLPKATQLLLNGRNDNWEQMRLCFVRSCQELVSHNVELENALFKKSLLTHVAFAEIKTVLGDGLLHWSRRASEARNTGCTSLVEGRRQ